MTKHGALRLKKSSFLKQLPGFLGAVLLFSLFFACKSSPEGIQVNPLELLDENNALYMAVPKEADPELLEYILKSNINGLSDKDAGTVVSRINKVYCGLSTSKKKRTFQCAVSGNIPLGLVPKVFSRKSGFSKTVYQNPEGTSFDIYNYEDFTCSFPDGKTFVAGRNLTGMLDKFESLSKGEDVSEPVLEDQFFNFLSGCKNTICFYANKPQSFLTMLTGVNLDLKLNYVTGEIRQDKEKDSQYLLDMAFDFKNERFAKAGKAVLTLAFGLTDSINNMDSTTTLVIRGIKINKKQLYKLLEFN